MECKNCNTKNDSDANFCRRCGKKLRETCSCWIKNKPYNCGEDKCPSYRLYKKMINQK